MRIGNVSFGSVYAVNYQSKRITGGKLSDRFYVCCDENVDEFIREFDRRCKGENDVSSFNPEKQMYYMLVENKSDKKLEKLAKKFKVDFKKVDRKEMDDSKIMSVGYRDGKNEELDKISSAILSYSLKKEMEQREHEQWAKSAD